MTAVPISNERPMRLLPLAPLLSVLLLTCRPIHVGGLSRRAGTRRRLETAAATKTNSNALNSTTTDSSTEIGKFLWFSDFHLDPLYGQEGAFNGYGMGRSCSTTPSSASAAASDAAHGRYGCDSPPGLVGGAIAASRQILPTPDFVLVTGDLSRHGNEEYFEDEDYVDPLVGLSSILTRVSKMLNSSFGDIVISGGGGVIPCVGNNDVTPDYYLDLEDTNNTVLNVIADAFVNSGIVQHDSEEERTLRIGGYLSRSVDPNLTVISLNTVPYLTNHAPAGQTPRISDPYGQFDWLRTQLLRARNVSSSVYIIGHIPPTVGSYRHAQFWKEAYLNQYREILEEFADVVAGHLFGHLHSDEFRVLDDDDGWDDDDGTIPLPPLLLAGSVTPIFRSNPTFRIVTHRYGSAEDGGGTSANVDGGGGGGEGGGNILDYETYYLDLGGGDGDDGGGGNNATSSWTRLYSFAESYGVPDLSSSSLRHIVQIMEGGAGTYRGGAGNVEDTMTADDVMEKFLTYLHGDAPSARGAAAACDASCRAEWVCTLTSSTRDGYDSCLPPWYRHRGSSSSSAARKVMVIVSLSIVCTAALLFVGLSWYRRRYRMRSMYEAHTDEVAMEVVEGRGGREGGHGLGGDDGGRSLSSGVVGAMERGGSNAGRGDDRGGVAASLPAIS